MLFHTPLTELDIQLSRHNIYISNKETSIAIQYSYHIRHNLI